MEETQFEEEVEGESEDEQEEEQHSTPPKPTENSCVTEPTNVSPTTQSPESSEMEEVAEYTIPDTLTGITTPEVLSTNFEQI